MDINLEKLKYLLYSMDLDLCVMIDEVLSDSETDPHFSAVTTTNKIKCFITVMKELGESLPYSSVKEFFEFNVYTAEEYERFECLRKIESEYYRGIQY